MTRKRFISLLCCLALAPKLVRMGEDMPKAKSRIERIEDSFLNKMMIENIRARIELWRKLEALRA